MNEVHKRQILSRRRELLRGYIEAVGETPGFTRALEQTENELRELEAEPQPQGS
jgi:hypothetical protein